MGFDAGPADGVFGRKTVAALARFQNEQQISESGSIGPQTKARLAEMVKSLSKSDPIAGSVIGKLIQLDQSERTGPPESGDPFFAKRQARRSSQTDMLYPRKAYIASEEGRTY